MSELIIRVDRRAEVIDELRKELSSLGESVVDLEVEFVSPDAVQTARDEGKFRDFVEVARLRHENASVLEWAAEELVDEFGWLVDIGRPPSLS